MSRYIDADRLDELITQLIKEGRNITRNDYKMIDSILFEFPTADVVEVVRCKDCIHCDCSIDGMGFFYCDFDEGRTVSPNGFCDVAERRKEAEDDTTN